MHLFLCCFELDVLGLLQVPEIVFFNCRCGFLNICSSFAAFFLFDQGMDWRLWLYLWLSLVLFFVGWFDFFCFFCVQMWYVRCGGY